MQCHTVIRLQFLTDCVGNIFTRIFAMIIKKIPAYDGDENIF